ncbi:MaoC-like domain-containing protein, partial [Pseudomonas coronafaciens pv. garcae]
MKCYKTRSIKDATQGRGYAGRINRPVSILFHCQDSHMTQVTNTPYEALEVGQTASYSKKVEERDIQLFAAMSGDHNPVHLDAEYASKTMFKERIAHGMFSGALISA